MKSFREFIIEVIDWENNTLFAVGPEGIVEYYDDRKGRMIEHPDAFRHLNFANRPHSGEILIGIEDLRDKSAKGMPGIDRPMAIAWGRIDHKNNVLHIRTQHGDAPYGSGHAERDKIKRKNDVFTRIKVLDKIQKDHPELIKIHHGYEEGDDLWSSPRTPRIITTNQYRKELMDHLDHQ